MLLRPGCPPLRCYRQTRPDSRKGASRGLALTILMLGIGVLALNGCDQVSINHGQWRIRLSVTDSSGRAMPGCSVKVHAVASENAVIGSAVTSSHGNAVLSVPLTSTSRSAPFIGRNQWTLDAATVRINVVCGCSDPGYSVLLSDVLGDRVVRRTRRTGKSIDAVLRLPRGVRTLSTN